MKQSGKILVDPELQNSHFNQQRKFFCSGSGSERRRGATVHI